MWEAFMAELRSLHLGAMPPQRSVIGELTDAYLAVLAGRIPQAPNSTSAWTSTSR
jgi:hypothetical protein